jgi:signal transduction histidine kinase
MTDRKDTLNAAIRANRFFEGFSSAGRERLLCHALQQEVAEGGYLFYEGDPADGIYLLLEGDVDIIKEAGNTEQILGYMQAGDFLGEVSVLDGCGRSTTARARNAVAVARIPGGILLDILATEPVSLTLRLFQTVLSHLRHTNDLFVQEVLRKEKLSILGTMASALMHDLRNPIAGIHMAADLISFNHPEHKETAECCDKIRLQCDRLVAMAGELLEFSRDESKLQLVNTDSTTFLQQYHHLNEDYFRSTGLEFNFQAKPCPIQVDSMRLMRLLQNLVTNAVDVLRSKPDGRIDVTAWGQGSFFYLSVQDNGPGIPAEIRDRIFEPFFTHGKKGGTGLGMAIVHNVVLAHGGTITFETAAGQGTKFIVQLPLAANQTE